MPSRLPSNRDAEQQLPFTGDDVNDTEFAQDLSHAENGGHTLAVYKVTFHHRPGAIRVLHAQSDPVLCASNVTWLCW
jgi:hypothetical protein